MKTKKISSYVFLIIAVVIYGSNYFLNNGAIGIIPGTISVIFLILAIIRFFKERIDKKNTTNITNKSS